MSQRLKAYLAKRDFSRTPEPTSGGEPSDRPMFVIQEHDATSHHFDVRLEIDGVLVSWAVPKGPSTDPREKRLAIRTEDHPLSYRDFEGVIPDGEYGAGTVIVWDAGPYRNLRADKDDAISMAESLNDGRVEVALEGEKLRGGYAFVRTGERGGKERWLMIKMRDADADARRNPISTEPQSVVSGRTLKQTAEGGA